MGFCVAEGGGDDSVTKHGLQDVEPIRYGGWSKPGGKKKEGGGIEEEMYADDLGNLGNAGRNGKKGGGGM